MTTATTDSLLSTLPYGYPPQYVQYIPVMPYSPDTSRTEYTTSPEGYVSPMMPVVTASMSPQMMQYQYPVQGGAGGGFYYPYYQPYEYPTTPTPSNTPTLPQTPQVYFFYFFSTH